MNAMRSERILPDPKPVLLQSPAPALSLRQESESPAVLSSTSSVPAGEHARTDIQEPGPEEAYFFLELASHKEQKARIRT